MWTWKRRSTIFGIKSQCTIKMSFKLLLQVITDITVANVDVVFMFMFKVTTEMNIKNINQCTFLL